MAVWKAKCGGAEIKIHDFDHPPPHCHVNSRDGHMKVNLWTLEVMKPVHGKLTPAIRKCLRQYQEEMLKAWDKVRLAGS